MGERKEKDHSYYKRSDSTDDEEELYTCSKCGYVTNLKTNLTRHEEKCKEEKTLCGKCRKPFKSYICRYQHEKTCKINKSTHFKCMVCSSTFTSSKDLIAHENQTGHNSAGGSSGSNNSSKKEKKSLKRSVSENIENCADSKRKKSQNGNKRIRCRQCDNVFFDDYKELYLHRMFDHHQHGGSMENLQSEPWKNKEGSEEEYENPPWVDENGEIDEKLKKTYDQHRHLILRNNDMDHESRNLDLHRTYNFPISNDVSLDTLMDRVEQIYETLQNSFKINLSFGTILINVETGDYRYFVPYYNDNLFPRPVIINSRDDLERLRSRLAKLDVSKYIMKQRPNTKFKPYLITNVNFDIYISDFPLGLNQPLPEYITNSKSIISLEIHPRTHHLYNDDLCFFRCLAYHQTKSRYTENKTTQFLKTWTTYIEDKPKISREITLGNLSEVEKCFEVNVHVYSLSPEKTATVRYKSMETYRNTNGQKNNMYLNLYEDHLSYITNLKSYCKKYECRLCKKLFSRQNNCHNHEKVCNKATKLKFPGGFYSVPKTIFETLEEFDISVEQSKREYPWFIVFDMEALLIQIHETDDDDDENHQNNNLKWTMRHEPISVSICSNVEGYESEKFILDPDLDSLLDQMLHCMSEIAEKSFKLSQSLWQEVFDTLEKLEQEWLTKVEQNQPEGMIESPTEEETNENDHDEAMETNAYEPPSRKFLKAMRRENVYKKFIDRLEKEATWDIEYNDWAESDSDDDEEEAEADQEQNQSEQQPLEEEFPIPYRTACLMLKQIRQVKEKFTLYCKQIPVLGFNSAKYDLNLIKSKLATHLGLYERGANKFIVKRNNAYMCIANQQFRFLDMMNYLPPGTSYDKFLVTFGVPVRKGYFCYEYFNDVEQLDETELPQKEAFYSSLKQHNVLENEKRVKFERLVEIENKTEDEALIILGLESAPESDIDENYSYLQRMWEEHSMVTCRDFLKWYNNLDVGPFVQGILAYKQFFRERNIDIFKDCISIPGAARQMLFRSGIRNGGSFALINRADKELYYLFKQGLFGGPSIIFTRNHSVDETYIRNDETRPCKNIVGYDANSLYLYAIMQPMPVGNYVRRKKSTEYRPYYSNRRYTAMYNWMDWLNNSQNINIKHKMKYGYERRIGPYLVDGFDPNTKTLYEFFGCYYHGHLCAKTQYVSNQTWLATREKRYQDTMNRLEFLKSQGYKVEYIWECEYQNKKEDEDMATFIENRRLPFHCKYPYAVSQEKILEAIVDETLFGCVEIDLEVPLSWDEVKYKPDTMLPPYQYFEEMSPIFCTTNVPFDCIGEHMQEHAKDHGLSQKPRKLLVGGMRAEKIFLATPLVKWYIEHGLKVTLVHQVVEFSKLACFTDFGKQVTTARRMGDADPSLEILATINKLIGNSSFGGTIINLLNYLRIKYCKGRKQACMAVNNPRFRHLCHLSDDIYETEYSKSNVTVNLPIQLGYMILNYAKLSLLKFYYDCLLKYVDRRDFEYLEVDTDSHYMALSGNSLLDVTKSDDKKQELQKDLYENCRDEYYDENQWFPRECCRFHKKYDSRTPGLMKIEFEGGKEMIGLCSKTYMVMEKNTGKVKYSLKGANKKMIDPYDKFRSALESRDSSTVENRGIRLHKNQLHTYTQAKYAFTYFYCKRKVLSDGIHTVPLDLKLTPLKYHKDDDDDDDSVLDTKLA